MTSSKSARPSEACSVRIVHEKFQVAKNGGLDDIARREVWKSRLSELRRVGRRKGRPIPRVVLAEVVCGYLRCSPTSQPHPSVRFLLQTSRMFDPTTRGTDCKLNGSAGLSGVSTRGGHRGRAVPLVSQKLIGHETAVNALPARMAWMRDAIECARLYGGHQSSQRTCRKVALVTEETTWISQSTHCLVADFLARISRAHREAHRELHWRTARRRKNWSFVDGLPRERRHVSLETDIEGEKGIQTYKRVGTRCWHMASPSLDVRECNQC